MPLLTRLFIKSALVYLVAALLVGAALTAQNVWDLPPLISVLTPTFFHLLMIGWVTQLIFGIVYWMFPKYSKQSPHGNKRLWLATYWLLNLGLILRVVNEPMLTLGFSGIENGLQTLAGVLQWLAGVLFVFNIWPRVKER